MDDRELQLDRIRTLFGTDNMVEKRMFGGNAFMFQGNMAVGLMGSGELMVRVGPDAYEDALSMDHAREMDFTGRSMRGYVYVDPPGWNTDEALDAWVQRGKEFAGSLPPK